jgi:hypothetical protein
MTRQDNNISKAACLESVASQSIVFYSCNLKELSLIKSKLFGAVILYRHVKRKWDRPVA